MKKCLSLCVLLMSFSSFGSSVVDSMYETDLFQLSSNRDPASETSTYCLLNEEQKVFGKSCYSSLALCNKRLNFWKDLPGVKSHSCVKI